MATKAERAERERVEAAVRAAAKDSGFLCPDCRRRVGDFVLNAKYGYLCRQCDWVAGLES